MTRHLMTGRFLAGVVILAVTVGVLIGGTVASLAMSPEGHPATGVITEDDPRWDCVRMGNRTCRINGVLMTSIDDMPTDPIGRCVYLMDIPRRIDPDGLTYVDSVCEPIRQQLG